MVASVAFNLAIHHSFERSDRERDCEPWSESARVVEVGHHPFADVVYHGVKENEETEQTLSCWVSPQTFVQIFAGR
ncbi:hypothetical protein V6N13_048189 [Hibiscus sabdariffa]|uniref:Uncharacterized protein n=1 Tax=Hibiscus sabdariffa TaxID=183260 RepID=A0ABR2F6G7_9ROSI